jgi:hypothetical protein
MPSSKKIYLLRDNAAGDYLSDTPPPYTDCKRTLHVLIHTGKGGEGESLTREKVRGAAVHKA